MATKRTTLRSSKGKKLYAVRSADGTFKDIQTYERAHRADLAKKSKTEKAAADRKKAIAKPAKKVKKATRKAATKVSRKSVVKAVRSFVKKIAKKVARKTTKKK